MKVALCTGVSRSQTSLWTQSTCHPLQGDPFKASYEDIKYIAIQGNDAPDVSRRALLPHRNMSKCDYPHRFSRLNEDWKRTQVSLTELNKADAVIMVLSCEMALSRSEMDFIESRLIHHNAGSFFVWNRYDAVWNDDQEIAALRSRSQSRLQKYQNQVTISAREAWLLASVMIILAIHDQVFHRLCICWSTPDRKERLISYVPPKTRKKSGAVCDSCAGSTPQRASPKRTKSYKKNRYTSEKDQRAPSHTSTCWTW